jgi:hypothetical protein
MKLNIKKQTAVDWLIKELINYDKLLDGKRKNDDATMFKANPIKIYEQAKAMEKEQNQNFYIEGRDFANYAHDEEYGGIEYWDREPMGFEQYYNETYNQ